MHAILSPRTEDSNQQRNRGSPGKTSPVQTRRQEHIEHASQRFSACSAPHSRKSDSRNISSGIAFKRAWTPKDSRSSSRKGRMKRIIQAAEATAEMNNSTAYPRARHWRNSKPMSHQSKDLTNSMTAVQRPRNTTCNGLDQINARARRRHTSVRGSSSSPAELSPKKTYPPARYKKARASS